MNKILLQSIILSALFFSCGESTQTEQKNTPENNKPTSTQTEQKNTLENKKQISKDSIDVSDLIYEFEMNQISATNKYKDNQITVSGDVDSVGFDIFTNIPQIKITDGSAFAFSGVQCNLSDETQSSGIQAGDKIEVNGVVKEFDLIDVILSNCVVK